MNCRFFIHGLNNTFHVHLCGIAAPYSYIPCVYTGGSKGDGCVSCPNFELDLDEDTSTGDNDDIHHQ